MLDNVFATKEIHKRHNFGVCFQFNAYFGGKKRFQANHPSVIIPNIF